MRSLRREVPLKGARDRYLIECIQGARIEGRENRRCFPEERKGRLKTREDYAGSRSKCTPMYSQPRIAQHQEWTGKVFITWNFRLFSDFSKCFYESIRKFCELSMEMWSMNISHFSKHFIRNLQLQQLNYHKTCTKIQSMYLFWSLKSPIPKWLWYWAMRDISMIIRNWVVREKDQFPKDADVMVVISHVHLKFKTKLII